MSRIAKRPVRKQYHIRNVGDDVFFWDVHRLMREAQKLTSFKMAISEIGEADSNWWYSNDGEAPTPRSIAKHVALVRDVDPSYPIILCSEGFLMDGMHRVVRAISEGQTHIAAVRFPETPKPDYVNVSMEYLPYPDEHI